MEMLHAGSSAGGAVGGAFEQSTAGQASGGAPSAEGGASAAKGGATPADGGAPLAEAGAAGWAGDAGAGGTADQAPSLELLVGDYDVYFPPPPALDGCSPALTEPRLNLALSFDRSGKLEAQLYSDFYWQAESAQAPRVRAGTVEVLALSDWAHQPVAPALTLDSDAHGIRGTGFAEIPYTCQKGASKTQRVPVKVERDHTPPQLRVDPVGFTILGFTHFSIRFSEPLALPSGNFDMILSEPSDGEQTLELYDVDTNAVPPAIWQWSLGGPVSEAHFVDPASVEGRTIAVRLIAPLADRAGNPLLVLAQSFYIQRSAVLDSEIDFDHEPAVGVFDNASYHAAAAPGAECEQGGCLVLDGPVVPCFGAPRSTFAVRLSTRWDTEVQVRYRVWASAQSVEPLDIAYPSGCSASFYTDLSALPQPAGDFTHVSAWNAVKFGPCGGPDNENGFTLSLPCTDITPPPAVRVVLERITRSK
ncbi:MAG TPA: hypothetical protein VHM25_05360 [Polyangiaceae bacterium]|jgi:hypothetical protein|nr:hypothetical protein [Polyangiaceae bacterium]